MVVAGAMNLATGLLVHKIPLVWLVTVTSALSVAAPMLMALINPSWPYWYAGFPAQILQPLSPDGEFLSPIIPFWTHMCQTAHLLRR
jgi:hypothetical protein